MVNRGYYSRAALAKHSSTHEGVATRPHLERALPKEGRGGGMVRILQHTQCTVPRSHVQLDRSSAPRFAYIRTALGDRFDHSERHLDELRFLHLAAGPIEANSG